MFTIDSFVLFVFFHNTPFTVFLRAEVIFFTAVPVELRYLFYMLYKPIKTGVMLLIQSLFVEGG